MAASGLHGSERHPHSFLSEKFRYAIREQSDLRSIILAKLIATSALCSHYRMDIDSGQSVQLNLVKSAMSTIPYMSSGLDNGERDRDRAVELFNEVADDLEAFARRLSKAPSGKVDIETE